MGEKSNVRTSFGWTPLRRRPDPQSSPGRRSAEAHVITHDSGQISDGTSRGDVNRIQGSQLRWPDPCGHDEHRVVDPNESDTGEDSRGASPPGGVHSRSLDGTQYLDAGERARHSMRPLRQELDERRRLGLGHHELHERRRIQVEKARTRAARHVALAGPGPSAGSERPWNGEADRGPEGRPPARSRDPKRRGSRAGSGDA
jgi:hypothetical protein